MKQHALFVKDFLITKVVLKWATGNSSRLYMLGPRE